MTLLDRDRLREAEHPLQLHLSGAHPHAVRGRLPRARTIPGREARDAEARCPRTSRSDAWARPDEVAPSRSISARTKRRSSPARRIPSTAACSPHEAHSVRRARAGSGRACSCDDGERVDVSAFGRDYDEAFFGGGRPARAARLGWRARAPRAARARRHAPGTADRAGRARSSASASTSATTPRRRGDGAAEGAGDLLQGDDGARAARTTRSSSRATRRRSTGRSSWRS